MIGVARPLLGEFRSTTHSTRVEVLKETKLIDEVRCIVVRDVVTEDKHVIESTNNLYAQAKDGNVWYCGEETHSFETFKGDRPMNLELVSIDGSFKAGRKGDKPGVIFLASRQWAWCTPRSLHWAMPRMRRRSCRSITRSARTPRLMSSFRENSLKAAVRR